MKKTKRIFSVFTKPWKEQSLEQLAALVAQMGFDAVEYPLRSGYQVGPQDGAAGMRRLAEAFGKEGVAVASIACGIDVRYSQDGNKVLGVNEELFYGCREAGASVIRICQGLRPELGFQQNLDAIRRQYDAFLPMCEKYGVTVGVQMHCGRSIANSAETLLLLQGYDPKYIAAVWDSGHSGLAGSVPAMAIDMLWDRLCMVNFKAAYRRRTNGPEAAEAQWEEYWTTGRNACGSWREAVRTLAGRGYEGVVCLPAEYDDEAHVREYAEEDLRLIKTLFAQEEGAENNV